MKPIASSTAHTMYTAVLRNAAKFGARNGIGFSWLATASAVSQCSICMKPKEPKSLAIQRRIANSMYGQAIPPKRDVHSVGIGRVAAAALARSERLWLPATCVHIGKSLFPFHNPFQRPVKRDPARAGDRKPRKQCQVLCLIEPQQCLDGVYLVPFG